MREANSATQHEQQQQSHNMVASCSWSNVSRSDILVPVPGRESLGISMVTNQISRSSWDKQKSLHVAIANIYQLKFKTSPPETWSGRGGGSAQIRQLDLLEKAVISARRIDREGVEYKSQ